MKFAVYLALRNLLRNPGRNLLYILGISITAALLLDMILLAGGLSISIEQALRAMGYEIRISPRGTLPFETDAKIYNFNSIQTKLESHPEVTEVDALLATSVTISHGERSFSAFAAGLKVRRSGTYLLLEGTDTIVSQPDTIVINRYLANAERVRIGDVLQIRTPQHSQMTGSVEASTVRVTGIADFHLDAEGQYSFSCSLKFLQTLLGLKEPDPVSVILIKLKKADRAERIVSEINRDFPQLSAYTITSVIDAVDKQLSYFKQFSYILGGISLIVTFVLVFIITTISFHDRVGEIALLRAIGLSGRTIFSTILFEGIFTSIASAVFGFVLGKFVAIYLDTILTSAPGLPQDFSFFVFEPNSVAKAVFTLLMTGFFAGLYPAFAAIRLPVAETLREEIL